MQLATLVPTDCCWRGKDYFAALTLPQLQAAHRENLTVSKIFELILASKWKNTIFLGQINFGLGSRGFQMLLKML